MQSKYLIIEDFLDPINAQEAAEEINSSKSLVHAYRTTADYMPEKFTGSPKDLTGRSKAENLLQSSLVSGEFTFRQRRLEDHHPNCRCGYCKVIKDTLDTEDFKEYLSALSDISPLEIVKSFASVYEPGDFLSRHTDPNYDIAFILNLTEDWKYEYGGCLHIFEEGIPKVIYPKFNSLVLMFLDGGIDHYVSEVSRLAPHPRIAISGWYNRTDK